VLYLMVSARVNSSFGPTHSEMTELLDLVEAHDDVWKQILDGRWNPCPCDGDTAPKGSLPCSPDHPCSYAKGALT
jgi:hypothetical protein